MISRFLIISIWILGSLGALQPDFVYLTWEGDPTTTAVVRWGSKIPNPNAKISTVPQVATVKQLEEEFFLHSLQLKDLQSGVDYVLQIEGDNHEYKFRTMPRDLSKVTFVVGGDTYGTVALFRQMNQKIVQKNPDFVVIGGDIAYSYRKKNTDRDKQLERWKDFFSDWHNTTAYLTGSLIPMMVSLGNHDVKASKDPDIYRKELFYEFFQGEPHKRVDFGNYLSLFLLDSGHNTTINGYQTRWLKKSLEEVKDQPYKFAVYHVGAYPSVYSFAGSKSKRIRDNWSPLFEKHHVQLAFEHHNHAYKRTKAIKDGKLIPDGVVYLGDGSWGVPIRTPKKPKQLWYLEKSAAKNAVFLLTLDQTGCLVQAMDIEGEIFDSLTFMPLVELAN